MRRDIALIFNALEIAIINAWLIYRRFCSQLHIPIKKQIPLLTFISRLAEALFKSNKPMYVKRPVGRPTKRSYH